MSDNEVIVTIESRLLDFETTRKPGLLLDQSEGSSIAPTADGKRGCHD